MTTDCRIVKFCTPFECTCETSRLSTQKANVAGTESSILYVDRCERRHSCYWNSDVCPTVLRTIMQPLTFALIFLAAWFVVLIIHCAFKLCGISLIDSCVCTSPLESWYVNENEGERYHDDYPFTNPSLKTHTLPPIVIMNDVNDKLADSAPDSSDEEESKIMPLFLSSRSVNRTNQKSNGEGSVMVV